MYAAVLAPGRVSFQLPLIHEGKRPFNGCELVVDCDLDLLETTTCQKHNRTRSRPS